MTEYNPAKTEEYLVLVYTTQVTANTSHLWAADDTKSSLISNHFLEYWKK